MISRKRLPLSVTSYDFLKSAAVALMVVDHLGYYFYDGENWPRVVGRLCVPIWFFLIGYARSRTLEKRLWIGAAILGVGRFAAGMPVLPVSVLGAFLVIRSIIDRLMLYATKSNKRLIMVNLAIFLLALPSSYLFEYGTLGLALSMFGWIVRRSQDLDPTMPKNHLGMQMGWSALTFVSWEIVMFSFDRPQGIALSIGVLAILGTLMFFHSFECPRLNRPIWKPVRLFLQIGGRWTLEIYVAHVILFQTIASVIDPERFTAFRFVLFQG